MCVKTQLTRMKWKVHSEAAEKYLWYYISVNSFSGWEWFWFRWYGCFFIQFISAKQQTDNNYNYNNVMKCKKGLTENNIEYDTKL